MALIIFSWGSHQDLFVGLQVCWNIDFPPASTANVFGKAGVRALAELIRLNPTLRILEYGVPPFARSLQEGWFSMSAFFHFIRCPNFVPRLPHCVPCVDRQTDRQFSHSYPNLADLSYLPGSQNLFILKRFSSFSPTYFHDVNPYYSPSDMPVICSECEEDYKILFWALFFLNALCSPRNRYPSPRGQIDLFSGATIRDHQTNRRDGDHRYVHFFISTRR